MPDPSIGDPAPTLLIDGRPHEALGPTMTGAQLLALAGKSADDAELWAEGHHGQRIRSEEAVPVQEGGRFVTRPRSDAPART